MKLFCQQLFSDGLVTIVGSGLSAAEGISGMGALAEHLQSQIPDRVGEDSRENWNSISRALAEGLNLESALLAHAPTDEVEVAIRELTAELILVDEAKVVRDVFSNGRCLRFTKLLGKMLKPANGIPIITTNYDRLIEVAVECAGLSINSLFTGHHIARHDPVGSRNSLCRMVTRRRGPALKFCEHATILKPHGSLDWYDRDNEPVRCTFPVEAPRLMITPGRNKFRAGYNQPFDVHRETANREIDKAKRFLIVGYGFGDEHLQTHLELRLRRGNPGLILTHTLSDNALKLLDDCPSLTAISSKPDCVGAQVHRHGVNQFFPGADLWDLDSFITEVLQ